ncbi:hypothetical protein CVT24_011172 [Panaeolus cyanescens]|uniref:F-box domain-containing protein n=1 Tax=Panaeolus cyanescens TaxID=181874 RepID=A0A409YGC6_9AGAR|nr:hypothetical protein CVT24_011172 [Panaeolus cyanescens]
MTLHSTLHSGNLVGLQNSGHARLPTLYTDIISTVLSFIDISEDLDVLLNCALVCKEWCQLSRRFSFAKLDDIHLDSLPKLRALLEPEVGSDKAVVNTFSKHVRRVILYVDLGQDDWTQVKELITLMNRYFTVKFKLSVMLRSGIVRSSHLSDIKSCCANTTHLGLISVKLDMIRDELADVLCDQSWPALTDMSIEGAVFKDPENATSHCQSDNGTPTRRLTLKHLHFLEEQSDDGRFWPHETFQMITVEYLIIRVDVLGGHFWGGVPSMLKKIAPSLVGLDVAHEMDYNRFTQAIQGLTFPKLQILKLKIVQGSGYSAGRALPLGDTEFALKHLLKQLDLPVLHNLTICIANAREYIGQLDGEYHLEWALLDEAAVALHERYNRLAKVVIAAWFEDWYEMEYDELRRNLEGKLPRCALKGLTIDFEILDYVDLDGEI